MFQSAFRWCCFGFGGATRTSSPIDLLNQSEEAAESKLLKETAKTLRASAMCWSCIGMIGCIIGVLSIIMSAITKYPEAPLSILFEPISRLGYGDLCTAMIFKAGTTACMISLTGYAAFALRLLRLNRTVKTLSCVGIGFLLVSEVGIAAVLVFSVPSEVTFSLHIAGGSVFFAATSIGALILMYCLRECGLLTLVHYACVVTGFVSGITVAITGIQAIIIGGNSGSWFTMTADQRLESFNSAIEKARLFPPAQWVYLSSTLCWYFCTAARTFLLGTTAKNLARTKTTK